MVQRKRKCKWEYMLSWITRCLRSECVKQYAMHKYEIKFKTAQTNLQDCTEFSGTVLAQLAASHFMFQCTKYACRWRTT